MVSIIFECRVEDVINTVYTLIKDSALTHIDEIHMDAQCEPGKITFKQYGVNRHGAWLYSRETLAALKTKWQEEKDAARNRPT